MEIIESVDTIGGSQHEHKYEKENNNGGNLHGSPFYRMRDARYSGG